MRGDLVEFYCGCKVLSTIARQKLLFSFARKVSERTYSVMRVITTDLAAQTLLDLTNG